MKVEELLRRLQAIKDQATENPNTSREFFEALKDLVTWSTDAATLLEAQQARVKVMEGDNEALRNEIVEQLRTIRQQSDLMEKLRREWLAARQALSGMGEGS